MKTRTISIAVSILLAVSAASAQTVINIQPPQETAKQTITIETERAPVPAAHPPRTVAMIVQNHASPSARIPMLALTDALTAKLSGRGFRVINPYNAFGSNQNRTQTGEKMPAVSAMELARTLKADGAVTASVLDFLDSTRGTPPLNAHRYSIHIALNLTDAQTGATVCGETIKKMSDLYTNNQVAQNRQEYLRDLVYAAAEECAQRLEEKANAVKWEPTPPPPPPPPPKPLPPPPPSGPLTISEIDSSTDALISLMRQSSVFRENYNAAQKDIDRIPTAIIAGLVDLTDGKSPTADLKNLLAAGAQAVRMTLMKSRLFDAKDDEVVTALTGRIVANGNSPLEDGELMAALKQHGSPDFYVVGDLRYFTEQNKDIYRLRLALHNIHTGKIVWEDVRAIVKTRKEESR